MTSSFLAQDLSDLLADALNSMREAGDVEEAEETSDPRCHMITRFQIQLLFRQNLFVMNLEDVWRVRFVGWGYCMTQYDMLWHGVSFSYVA